MAEAEALWNAIAEQHAALLASIWQQVFGRLETASDPILYMGGQHYLPVLAIVNAQSWSWMQAAADMATLLPDPGPEWRLEETPKRKLSRKRRIGV